MYYVTSATGCCTKAKEPSLSYYLLIAGRRNGFLPFSKALVERETQTTLSSI